MCHFDDNASTPAPNSSLTMTSHSSSSVAYVTADVLITCGIGVVSLGGNALVLVSFVTQQRLRTAVNVFILNLALADICFGAFLPGKTPNLIHQRYLYL